MSKHTSVRSTYTLGVDNDKVVLRWHACGRRHDLELNSVLDYIAFVLSTANEVGCDADDLTVMCSSSMDFPKDSTKNRATIKLAHALRADNLTAQLDAERAKMGQGMALSRKQRNQLIVLCDYLTARKAALDTEAHALELRRASLHAQVMGTLDMAHLKQQNKAAAKPRKSKRSKRSV